MLQYILIEAFLPFRNSPFQSEESTACFVVGALYDWDECESYLDVKHVLDVDVPHQQEGAHSFEGHFKFLVNEFGRRDHCEFVVVDVQEVVESILVDLSVAVGHKET